MAGPQGLVTATLHGSGVNDRLDLQARGLPPTNGVYVLWGRPSRGSKELLGRFMVDRRGSCRVRFSVPHRGWSGFSLTRSAA